jgi:hypothetical protein
MDQEKIIIEGQEIEQTKQLSFIDGVLACQKCYDMILQRQLDGVRDSDGCTYLAAINDDVTDLVQNGLLESYYAARKLEILTALKLAKIETMIKA